MRELPAGRREECVCVCVWNVLSEYQREKKNQKKIPTHRDLVPDLERGVEAVDVHEESGRVHVGLGLGGRQRLGGLEPRQSLRHPTVGALLVAGALRARRLLGGLDDRVARRARRPGSLVVLIPIQSNSSEL